MRRLAWAEESHAYFAGRCFYTDPDALGFLFPRGLHTAYRADRDGFIER